MNFFCPRCQHSISASDGTHVTCPTCGMVLDLAAVDTNVGRPAYAVVRDLTGETVGAYELQACLGSGGMGTVYRARDSRQGTLVAIKMLYPELLTQPDVVARFGREAEALKQLNHPAVVRFIEAGEHQGQRYLVMEYAEGESLEAVARRAPIPVAEAVKLALEVAEALGVAHTRGIVHRDLKPANVVVTAGGVKLVDFGIAHLELGEFTLTHSDAILGSINYMAPEQRVRAKEVDGRADIFALGVILYRLVTGALPMGSFDSPSSMNPLVPKALDLVILKMLKREPEQRYPDAAALALDLRRALPSPRQKLVRRLALAAAVATTVAVLGGGGWLVARSFPVGSTVGSEVTSTINDVPQAVTKKLEVSKTVTPNQAMSGGALSNVFGPQTKEGGLGLASNTIGTFQSAVPQAAESQAAQAAAAQKEPVVPMGKGGKIANALFDGSGTNVGLSTTPAGTATTRGGKKAKPRPLTTLAADTSLYEAPGTGQAVVRSLKSGEAVEYLRLDKSREGEVWREVRTDKGEIGWIPIVVETPGPKKKRVKK